MKYVASQDGRNEPGPIPPSDPIDLTQRCDALVMGGGLAGMTLALQLKRTMPELKVLVLERRAHPVPLACHKVGESSVEIGAHYFEHVLGLGSHLHGQQLRKFGFRFFFSEGRTDLHNVTELGASRPLPVPSYQIDRGLFENFLAEECQRRGIGFIDAATVTSVELGTGDAPHAVHWRRAANGAAQAVAPPDTAHASAAAEPASTLTHCTWLLDASGRAGLLRRKLKLDKPNGHGAHAVWFRIKGHIPIDRWSDNAAQEGSATAQAWQQRCITPTRWLSTNHLVGPGYWVWLIPLASGSHSVGIVADPRLQPLDEMDTFDKAMNWLSTHQPALFAELDGRREDLQDFAFFRRFSYDCAQVFSADRWALTGEAGRFLDPFYSPGSDFIAIGNTYITDLIERHRQGQRIQARAQIYEQVFRSFYDSTLALYQDQYALFGDPEVLPCKVIWDYTYYWSVLAQFFCQERLTDLSMLSRLKADLQVCQQLNLQVQAFMRRWGQSSARRNPAVMLDQASVPWFADLNGALVRPHTDEQFEAGIRKARLRLEQLAAQILHRACADHPSLDGAELRALIPETLRTDPGSSLLFPSPPETEACA